MKTNRQEAQGKSQLSSPPLYYPAPRRLMLTVKFTRINAAALKVIAGPERFCAESSGKCRLDRLVAGWSVLLDQPLSVRAGGGA
jgi:hypothetical protein